ncbi:TetR/AcrR family transcriptional regulator [Herbiconiux daphne]|uniref:TetR/AcrR family transcriptional regulator n=1 Tax=Herbiconiux daphne TaxID=2970914 RepID=A0ABT2H7F0_9MICO|nr:TetR/AcrR family transcriptional regulator [Herbiconiux daphne]MCS5735868.1 TetR/AcrR family transcriptional regulator [Herbiconiux daphne]
MPQTPKANRGPSAGPANRLALIAAAREVFGDGGYAAPLSAVAKRAGVGQGSLYRHFPDRISLAVAVFDENIGDLERVASLPDSTLDDLLQEVIDQALVSKALIDLIVAGADDERVAHLGTRVLAVVDTMVTRERSAGRVRADLTADDVMLAISMLAGVLTWTPGATRPDTAARAWSLLRRSFAPAPAPSPAP